MELYRDVGEVYHVHQWPHLPTRVQRFKGLLVGCLHSFLIPLPVKCLDEAFVDEETIAERRDKEPLMQQHRDERVSERTGVISNDPEHDPGQNMRQPDMECWSRECQAC